jgi:hypothetical protein
MRPALDKEISNLDSLPRSPYFRREIRDDRSVLRSSTAGTISWQRYTGKGKRPWKSSPPAPPRKDVGLRVELNPRLKRYRPTNLASRLGPLENDFINRFVLTTAPVRRNTSLMPDSPGTNFIWQCQHMTVVCIDHITSTTSGQWPHYPVSSGIFNVSQASRQKRIQILSF